MKRSTMLPVLMAILIVLVIIMTIAAERTNAPDVAGDASYPHHICTTNAYCEGDECSREPLSFVVYLSHADGQPRLELNGFSTRATLTEAPDGLVFESTGGTVSGTITVLKSRGLDITATSGAGADLVEHYASGSCERLVSP